MAAMVAGGVAAMEVVARDLKALGLYTARALSFEGVEYDVLEHRLTDDERAVYDRFAAAFKVIHRNLHAALEATGITDAESGVTAGCGQGLGALALRGHEAALLRARAGGLQGRHADPRHRGRPGPGLGPRRADRLHRREPSRPRAGGTGRRRPHRGAPDAEGDRDPLAPNGLPRAGAPHGRGRGRHGGRAPRPRRRQPGDLARGGGAARRGAHGALHDSTHSLRPRPPRLALRRGALGRSDGPLEAVHPPAGRKPEGRAALRLRQLRRGRRLHGRHQGRAALHRRRRGLAGPTTPPPRPAAAAGGAATISSSPAGARPRRSRASGARTARPRSRRRGSAC